MSRYQTVIKLGVGAVAVGAVFAPTAVLALGETELGSASKEGESLGGLHTVDQPRTGSGTFVNAKSERAPGEPSDVRQVRVAIVTEEDLLVDTEEFAHTVLDTLDDERSWGGDGSLSFHLASSEEADFTIYLATPDTVDELCAPLDTGGYTSCRVENDVVLNVERWAGATDDFLAAGGTVDEYRTYLVNHEVGHYLGYGHETECLPDGSAPVMMQQTLDLQDCKPNGWPNI